MKIIKVMCQDVLYLPLIVKNMVDSGNFGKILVIEPNTRYLPVSTVLSDTNILHTREDIDSIKNGIYNVNPESELVVIGSYDRSIEYKYDEVVEALNVRGYLEVFDSCIELTEDVAEADYFVIGNTYYDVLRFIDLVGYDFDGEVFVADRALSCSTTSDIDVLGDFAFRIFARDIPMTFLE